jgi:N-acetyl-anhydromuramyl-L-alanine amidase AmpD
MKTLRLILFVIGTVCSGLSRTSGVEIQDNLMTNGYKAGRLGGDSIDTVVVHFSSNVIADKQNPYDVNAVIKVFADNGVSAHYLIARDGKIFRLVKEKDTSYHAGQGSWNGRTNNLNRFSIGIELLGIGTYSEMHASIGMSQAEYNAIPKQHIGFTDKQYLALKSLLDVITTNNPQVKKDRKHIIGHDEYAPGRKYDPGNLFLWSKIGL